MSLSEELIQQAKENKRLIKYVQHIEDCSVGETGNTDSCDCGLTLIKDLIGKENESI